MINPELVNTFVNALTKIVAGNIGEAERISAREAGIQAAMEERVKDIGIKYVKNEISKEEARCRIKKTLIASSITFIVEKIKRKIDKSKKIDAVVEITIEKVSSSIEKFSKEKAEKLRRNKTKIQTAVKNGLKKAVEKAGKIIKRIALKIF